jgi:hypothetical protein
MDENLEEFKKIALRFLKERGLFNKWKKYWHDKAENPGKIGGLAGANVKNWYEKYHIDRIFGQENFTQYLQTYYGYRGRQISDEFRSYVITFYQGKYEFFHKSLLHKEIFDKDTHTFIKSTTNEEE